MKINAINNINYNSKAPAFKHTAVPYPEYELIKTEKHTASFKDKISALFNPEVSREAGKIKTKIDGIYASAELSAKDPKAQLLSVLA